MPRLSPPPRARALVVSSGCRRGGLMLASILQVPALVSPPVSTRQLAAELSQFGLTVLKEPQLEQAQLEQVRLALAPAASPAVAARRRCGSRCAQRPPPQRQLAAACVALQRPPPRPAPPPASPPPCSLATVRQVPYPSPSPEPRAGAAALQRTALRAARRAARAGRRPDRAALHLC